LAGCGGKIGSDVGTALELLEVQLEGRRRMSAQEFVNGYRLKSGDQLGE
jgi:methionyl-tRNA formyltransferase